MAEALNEIVAKVRQMDELVAEVADASREQADGILQINTAVTQMDKVTQSSAALAEESAAAAQELNAQAELMRQSVTELLRWVGHGAASDRESAMRGSQAARTPRFRLVVKKVTQTNRKQAQLVLEPGTSTQQRHGISLADDFKGI